MQELLLVWLASEPLNCVFFCPVVATQDGMLGSEPCLFLEAINPPIACAFHVLCTVSVLYSTI